MSNQKKVALSAVQPTNAMTLGNYVGAMRHWTRLQDQYDNIFFAVDQHAITLRQDPKSLGEQSYLMMATLLAAGLDPKASLLFLQSHVPEHSQLAWVLGCNAYMGELSRMTQFKDKSAKVGANIPVGLFTYPILMAADILLYRADVIPVGHDQTQHVELTRDIAVRMNNAYGTDLFTVPEPLIPKVGARIMSLQNPDKKMSKSDPDPKATIFLTDSDKTIAKKVKSAVTDSGNVIEFSEEKPGIRNLISIQSALSDRSPEEVVADYRGKQYGHLKVDTAELVVGHIAPIRNEAARLLADRPYLDKVMKEGSERARQRAQATLRRVFDAVGFVSPT